MAFARTYICALGALFLVAPTATNATAAWKVVASAAPTAASDIVTHADAGRKGTRNFQQDGSSGSTTTAPSISEYQAPTAAEKLQYCIDTWDAGTHISKSKWREICKRQLAAGE